MKEPKCDHCKKPFKRYRSTEKACSLECAIELGKKNVAKKLKEEKKAEKAKDKELKDNYERKHKKLSEYEAEAKVVFQKWVRERDKDLPCISCGSPTSNPFWDGGHYKKAEIYSGVIFHHDNCHKQCRKCNFYENGNEANYRAGLVKRIGIERVEHLELLADEVRRHKYTREDLIDIKKMYQQKLRNKDFDNGIIQ